MKKIIRINDGRTSRCSMSVVEKPSKYVRERMLLKHKPRKVLNLEERVQAIRMYDRNPIYQRVASVFQCSWEQIKNVILNRAAILQYYARCQTIDSNDNPHLVRNKKINFLGNVMHEYIKRAHYHRSAVLNDESIQQRALEIRDMLNIEKFYPNKAWINDFKHVYNIDWQRLKMIVITHVPPKSLNPKDIICYCTKVVEGAVSSKEQKQTRRRAAATTKTSSDLDGSDIVELGDADDDNVGGGIADNDDVDDTEILPDDGVAITEHDAGFDDSLYFGDADDDINEDEEGLTINYGDYDYNEDIVTDDLISTEASTEQHIESKSVCTDDAPLSPPPSKAIKLECSSNGNSPARLTTETSAATTTSTNVNVVDAGADVDAAEIQNYTEALKLLRPLQNFAILEEDFHSINLLAHLTQVYEKAIKRKKETY